MTKLLVSVRDVAEAQMAIDERVDLIDIKNPDRGSLGAADSTMIAAIADCVRGRVPLSVALGELSQGNSFPASLPHTQISFAKFGLAGCSHDPQWRDGWKKAVEMLPSQVTPVAVAYADWRLVAAPDPYQVLEHAPSLGCGALLLDTSTKQRENLLSYCDLSELRSLIAAAHRMGLLCVLAGSLGLTEIETLLPLAPDYVAVRGAACAGSRRAGLDRQRLRGLRQLVHPVQARAPLGAR